MRRHVSICGRGREGEQRSLAVRLVPNERKHGRKVDLIDEDADGFRRARRRRTIVRDAKGDGIIPRPLRFRGRPGEHAARRIDGGTGGGTGIQAVGQSLRGQVGVRGRGREREQTALVDLLVADGGQNGRARHLGNGEGDGFGITAGRRAVVRDPHGDDVVARPLGFRRRPREHPRDRIDARPGRRVREAVGQNLRGQIRIGRRGREHDQTALAVGLAADGRQHRGRGRFPDVDEDGVCGAELGAAIVRHPHHHEISLRSLRLRRGPGEQAARRNGGPRRRTGIQGESQRLRRQIRVRRRRREGELAAFIDRLVANRGEERGRVDLIDGESDDASVV